MISRRISLKLVNPVKAAFRRHCHRLLRIGYERALPRILSEPDEETDITGYICEALKNWFRENPAQFPGFDIKDDPPLAGDGKTGKRRSRADIIITFTAGDRPEFFFEAKRLHRSKAPGSRYTDDGGMGCFISGRYASRYEEAAMIGYVQSDSLERWRDELQQRVQNKSGALKLKKIEDTIPIPDALPLEWASIHGREKDLPEIRLFHLLLNCIKPPGELRTH